MDRIIRPNVAYKFVDGDAGEGVGVGSFEGADGYCIQHCEHAGEKREGDLWRSAPASYGRTAFLTSAESLISIQ